MPRNYPVAKSDMPGYEPMVLLCCACRRQRKTIMVSKHRAKPRVTFWCGRCYEKLYPGTNARMNTPAGEFVPLRPIAIP
jgi:hypothetical protein